MVVEKAVEKAVTPVYMANVIRTLSNEYHAAWNRGGRLFAESQGQGKGYRTLLCEGDSEKQLTIMKALIQGRQERRSSTSTPINPRRHPDRRPVRGRPASTS